MWCGQLTWWSNGDHINSWNIEVDIILHFSDNIRDFGSFPVASLRIFAVSFQAQICVNLALLSGGPWHVRTQGCVHRTTTPVEAQKSFHLFLRTRTEVRQGNIFRWCGSICWSKTWCCSSCSPPREDVGGYSDVILVIRGSVLESGSYRRLPEWKGGKFKLGYPVFTLPCWIPF